jgi:hypothetical protein
MAESGRILLQAVDKTQIKPTEFSKLVSVLCQIRLFSSTEVSDTAEQVVKFTLRSCQEKEQEANKQQAEKKEESNKSSYPVKKFSEACRKELESMRNMTE